MKKIKLRQAWLVVAAINADNEAILFSYYYRTKVIADKVYDLLQAYINNKTNYSVDDIEIHRVLIDPVQIIEIKDTTLWGTPIFEDDEIDDEDK